MESGDRWFRLCLVLAGRTPRNLRFQGNHNQGQRMASSKTGSSKSTAPLFLIISPSRWRYPYLLLLLVGGGVALFHLPMPWRFQGGLAVLYVSWLAIWSRQWHGNRTVGLRLETSGEAVLDRLGEKWVIRSVCCTYYTPILVVLRCQGDHRMWWLPIVADQVTPESWRRLRRWFARD